MIERIADKFSASFSNAVITDLGSALLIFIAGQVGMPAEGPPRVVAESFEEEARLCYRNVELALISAGATLKDLVRITAFLKSAEDYPVYDKVRNTALAGALPASATVIVADLLVNARLEVEAVAVLKKSGHVA
jgi:2-iminobutanoate/2-iminopropanoate deaminase